MLDALAIRIRKLVALGGRRWMVDLATLWAIVTIPVTVYIWLKPDDGLIILKRVEETLKNRSGSVPEPTLNFEFFMGASGSAYRDMTFIISNASDFEGLENIDTALYEKRGSAWARFANESIPYLGKGEARTYSYAPPQPSGEVVMCNNYVSRNYYELTLMAPHADQTMITYHSEKPTRRVTAANCEAAIGQYLP
jgi:hypothetical protein